MRADAGEHLDHAEHGAEQSQERRDRGDGAKRAQVTLQLRRNVPPGVFDRLAQDLAVMFAVHQAGCQYPSERRAGAHHLDAGVVEFVARQPLLYLRHQVGRGNVFLLQRPEALADDRQRRDRAQDDGPHDPATGLDKFEHLGFLENNYEFRG